MWYRTAQQQQIDIGLQRSQSNLNQNTGIYATFAESQKMRKALQDGTYAEISTPAGKMLSIHGSVDADGQYCGQIAPGQVLCGPDFDNWLRQKGFQDHQVITCEGGFLNQSISSEKAPIQIAIPTAPISTDSSSPMFLSIQKA